MTNRVQEIQGSLTALATALRQHDQQVTGSATTAQERALSSWEHGWDNVAQGYESAAEHLTEIAGALSEVCDRAERCAQILQPLHDEHGFTGVAERLGIAIDEIDTGLEGLLRQLDEARSTLAATGEKYLTGVLQDVIEKVQESSEALAAVQKEIAEEQASARPGESAGDTPAGDSTGGLAAIRTRIAELRRQGHAPQRHGAQITDQQLTDRALWGKDPMTGTTTDGVHGGPHQYSRNATKFTADEALVQAERHVRSTREYRNREVECQTTGRRTFVVRVSLSDVFGPNYLARVRGIRRAGSQRNPTGIPPGSASPELSDFHEGFVHAVFRRTSDGQYHLTTMYPDPKD
ncbi:hypothetical protein KIH74_33875 [Kineosporia sp. J2-2]|uniref:Bacterial CdiA-CT RNAse A domain-containing protein n=1 Tax=Kineosporia corallincola TaxID=2835133 RepID=A0ABS5TT72_9ACTN|nr:hypothetical protein [Kineosporia corallincola]MBT0773983.1 hypothetical protein [Kineosporia corallincola]